MNDSCDNGIPKAPKVFGSKLSSVRAASVVSAFVWIVLCVYYVSGRIESERVVASDELRDTMDKQLAVVVDRLESVFHEMANIAKIIALEPSAINVLEKLEPTRGVRNSLDEIARNSMLSSYEDVLEESIYLQEVVDNTSYLTGFILDSSGIYVSGNIWKSPGPLLGKDYSKRRYFRNAMETGSGIEFAVGKNRKVLSIFFSEAIQKGERRLGVATVRQGTAFLNAQLSVKDAEVMVVDDHGVIVASSRPQWVLCHLAPSGLPSPTSLADTYGMGAIEDAGVHVDPSNSAFVRLDKQNWLWKTQTLNPGGMTVWLISPEPKTEGIVHSWFVFGALAIVCGVLLIALVERSLEYTLSLRSLALHDQLTGLPNRNLLHDRLTLALARVKRRNGKLVVLFVDLDRFKQVNDTYGHEVGNMVLVEAARRLTASIRSSDTVGRVGGDEFVVVLEKSVREDASGIASKIIDALALPFEIGGKSCHIGVSIGISIAPEDGETMDALLQAADAAMYRAKEACGNCFFFCS